MKRLSTCILFVVLSSVTAYAQEPTPQIPGKEVARTDTVVFRQIDEHTWVGTGFLISNESVFLVEGNERAVLIDAGLKMPDLDKVVASITKKPVTLLITHGHRDHAGLAINLFPEMFIHPGDMESEAVANYSGKMRALKDGEQIDLGGRSLQVVSTPGHTPGSTIFLDVGSGYGFSGDAFGGGYLLLFGNFSTLIDTCERTGALMEELGIKFLYPGHYNGANLETRQRLTDIAAISRRVLSGELKGSPISFWGFEFLVTEGEMSISYNEASIQ